MISLGDLVRPIRARLWLGTAAAFTSAVLGLLPYVAVAEIARHLLGTGAVDSSLVWTWTAVGAAGVAARLGLLSAANLVTHYADADLQRDLRARIARHMATVPLGWFGGTGSGELKKAMEDDVEDMHHLVAHAMLDIVSAIGLPLAAVVYLLTVDWRLTLVTLAVLPLATLVLSFAYRTLPARMVELTTSQQQINNATIEYIDGIQVVKAYGQAGLAFRRFSAAVNRFCDTLAAWTAEAGRAMFGAMALLSPATVLLVVLGAGIGFVSAGWLTAVDLLPFLLVGVALPTPYMTLMQGTNLLRKARVAAAHLADVLSVAPLPAPETPRTPASSTVEFDAVTFTYDGQTPVLRDVSVTCPAGSMTAVVGPSGAGKTTLTRLVARFYDVTGGAVRIGGVDVREIPANELMRMVAMVFQDVVLVRDTVRENIRLGRPGASDAEVERAARAARMHETIEALPDGYDTVVDGRTGVLSGGERQRLTVARAILQDAPIVLLDEATAYVDPENETAVQDALATLTRGRTLLVVAHRLHTIVHADQILVLDDGLLVERGTHHRLLADGGRYAQLWQAQQTAELEVLR